jgi:hypothetical protein
MGDFCVNNGGAQLPDMLFLNVNSPMGDPNQIVRIDSSCDGVSGLTVLKPYGAVDLIGYTNNDGVIDCFVDVEYQYGITNEGPVKIIVTELDRVQNGEDMNLLEGLTAEDLILEPTGSLVLTEARTAETCTDNQVITTAKVVAEDANQVECDDTADYAYDIVVGTPAPIPMTPSASPPVFLTPVPSFEPTFKGSPDPSLVPSSAPSFIPPSDQCFVSIDVKCTSSDNSSENCGSILPLLTRCEDRPFAMVFRYNGGGCGQSFNIQPPDLFQCSDFQGGPPTVEGTLSYIVVTDIQGRGVVYQQGFVAVGDEYTVADGGNDVEANLNITIYNSDDTSPGNVLQTLILHSSCSSNLFLKDRFGASQLVVFVNEVQGVVSCFFNTTYSFTIENTADGNDAILQSLVSLTNFGTVNLTDQVSGVVLGPQDAITFNETVVLDLTVRQRYTALTTIIGESPQGFQCRNFDFFEFVAGNPLPPTFPTLSPTSSPTATPVPTPDPEGTACDLVANIRCDRVVDRGDITSCQNLSPPSNPTCLNSEPYRTSFLYLGGPCPGNNNANGFRCEDQVEGGPTDDQVVIDVVGDREIILFRGQVDLNEEFTAFGTFGDFITVTLYTLNEGGNAGNILQVVRIPTRCTAKDDFSVYNSYGALTLAGYTNDDGNVSGFETIRIDYIVTNSGSLASNVDSASSMGAFAGSQQLVSSPTGPVSRRDELLIGSEERRLNLAVEAGNSFAFSLELAGTTIAAGVGCTDDTTFSFSISS